MTKQKAYTQTQIRTRYRNWLLIATDHGVTGKKANGEHFEIAKAPNIEEALRLGKAKVNRIEGEEVWT